MAEPATRLRTLSDAIQAFALAADHPGELAPTIVHRIACIFDGACILSMPAEEVGSGIARYADAASPELARALRASVAARAGAVDDDRYMKRMVAAGKPVLVPRSELAGLDELSGLRCALIVPLISRGRALGSFSVSRYGEAALELTAADLELAETLGAYIALALGSLFDQTYSRSMIEASFDALITTDLDGMILDVNRRVCAVTGLGVEQLVGTAFDAHFTDPVRAGAGIRRVLKEDRLTDYELTIHGKDGRETVVACNATSFKDARGALRGVFVAARDLTEQKRLEQQNRDQNRALIETSAFVNDVLDSCTEYSIIANDLEGNIEAWNEGARRNYGYTAVETVGKRNALTLHTAEDIASGNMAALHQTALVTGKAEGVFERLRKNGERFTAAVSITLRRDASGVPVGFVLISKDITEQRRLEAQLEHRNTELAEQYHQAEEATRLKSEFLANMSHELRTPLNGIIGLAELMHDGKVGPVSPEHREYLGDILVSADHVLRLINDVLDLAKVEAGKLEFHPEPFDLAQLVGEVRDILNGMTAKRTIEIQVEIDPDLGELVLDPGKLKQVLYNFVSNAMKFSSDGGIVRIVARAENATQFRLEVSDAGIGIRTEDLARLFLEYEQLDASSSKRHPGTGLGLALTKRIVEAQGGTIGVTSTHGKGSVFHVVLPRVDGASRELRTGIG